MRIAIAEDTPGYDTYQALLTILDGKIWRIRIFIDREERKDVLMADEEAGEIWVWARDPDGGITMEENQFTGVKRPKRRSLKGFVQILVDGPKPPKVEG